MKINRIEVKNFRKLRNAVELENLGGGLTIIAGSNEDGKSTLLEAVRCALFQKHNLTGDHAGSLQPYHSTLRPQVTVEFEIRGQRYTIQKTFCQRPEALLTTPAGSFSGSAAEDKLQEVLQFSRPVRGATSENEQGIWGLLWVTQGSAYSPLILNEGARSSLQSAIEMQVGQVLGGRHGEHLAAAIKAEHECFFTETGRPTGQYQRAARSVDQLRIELNQKTSELSVYERELQELERIEARLDRWRKENTLSNLGLRCEQAKQARAGLELLLKERSHAEQELKIAAAQLELASGKREAREKDWRRLSEEESALADTTGRLATAIRSVEPLRSAESAAEGQRGTLEADQAALDGQLLEIERAVDHLHASAHLAELTRRFGLAEPARREIEKIGASLQLLTVDKKALKKLELLESEVNNAQVRLDVIATSVAIRLAGGVTANLDGESVGSSWAGRLTRKAELTIEGAAAISIVPGGSTQDFRSDLERHRKALQDALSKQGWETIDGAHQQLARKEQLENDLKLQNTILSTQAPAGLEDLRLEMAHRRQQVNAGSPNALTANTIDDLVSRRQALQKRRRTIADQLRTKDEELKLASKAMQEQEKSAATLGSERNRLAALAEQLKERLIRAQGEEPDELLAGKYHESQRAHDAILQTAVRLTGQIKEKNPELIELALEQTEQAHKQLKAEIEHARSRANDLRIALGAKGQLGLGEVLELLQGQLALAEAEWRRYKRRADAVKLLWSTVQSAERRAKEQYLIPVTERIRPYLEILLPGTELMLTEKMEVTGLKRGGVEEPYLSLSLGTREQLAVIVRLAFADLLHAHGQPAAVVLDDAIAYADAERLDRMLLVLRRAARHSQILVLTCRERDYERAGAPIIRLPDCARELPAMIA